MCTLLYVCLCVSMCSYLVVCWCMLSYSVVRCGTVLSCVVGMLSTYDPYIVCVVGTWPHCGPVILLMLCCIWSMGFLKLCNGVYLSVCCITVQYLVALCRVCL